MPDRLLSRWTAILLVVSMCTAIALGVSGCNNCLFFCNPMPAICNPSYEEIRLCRNGLVIRFADKSNLSALWAGIKKDFTLVIQSENSDDIKIACTHSDAENAQGPRPICGFSSDERVSSIFVEDITAQKINITIERENTRETHDNLLLSYTQTPFDPCSKPEPYCNLASLVLWAE